MCPLCQAVTWLAGTAQPHSPVKKSVPWGAVVTFCFQRVAVPKTSSANRLLMRWGECPKACPKLAFMHLGGMIRNPSIKVGFSLRKELSSVVPSPCKMSRSNAA